MAEQSKKNEFEPLLGPLVQLVKGIAARQKAVETMLIKKGIMTAQEWKAGLNAAQPPSGPNQSGIKNVATVAAYLETLAKH
ncbi:MAG: hypothetical protein ABSC23_13710 [Bryobacteraceae bacterium]|jgi:hypothetical protein